MYTFAEINLQFFQKLHMYTFSTHVYIFKNKFENFSQITNVHMYTFSEINFNFFQKLHMYTFPKINLQFLGVGGRRPPTGPPHILLGYGFQKLHIQFSKRNLQFFQILHI